jgi:hypothetical protein
MTVAVLKYKKKKNENLLSEYVTCIKSVFCEKSEI